MTKQYGILGYPAKHSLSPAVQNAAFKALGIDAQFGVFEVAENELPAFMEQVKHEPIYGLSVTAPYKEVIIQYLNEVAEDAREIGAVNTVVNREGLLYGYNVDYIGLIEALKEVCSDLRGRRVCVIGAGGAARAAIYGLLKEGAEVTIFNRTAERAKSLADEFGGMFGVKVGSGGLDEIGGDILIQTSSIWIADPQAKLEDLISPDVATAMKILQQFEVVMDVVYKPLKTPLIAAAEQLGKKFITGDKMFLYQAMEQFKLWIEKEAPVEVMGEALERVLV